MSIPIHLSLYNVEPGSSMLHHTACGTWGDLVTSDPNKVECLNCRRTKRFKAKKKHQP